MRIGKKEQNIEKHKKGEDEKNQFPLRGGTSKKKRNRRVAKCPIWRRADFGREVAGGEKLREIPVTRGRFPPGSSGRGERSEDCSPFLKKASGKNRT